MEKKFLLVGKFPLCWKIRPWQAGSFVGVNLLMLGRVMGTWKVEMQALRSSLWTGLKSVEIQQLNIKAQNLEAPYLGDYSRWLRPTPTLSNDIKSQIYFQHAAWLDDKVLQGTWYPGYLPKFHDIMHDIVKHYDFMIWYMISWYARIS